MVFRDHTLIGDSESAALTTGVEGKQFQAKAWKEIMDVLKQQSEGLEDALRGPG
jgi:hypothetical protein